MSIASRLQVEAELRTPLGSKINDGCKAVGGIYNLNYFSAVVLTNDHDKQEAGGVPLGGFLLAAAGKYVEDVFTLDDDEVILLRVKGTSPLPNEAELVQTRLAVIRDALSTGQDYSSVTDELTRNELQQSAFDCEVLGTFYTLPNSKRVEFGADIDNVVSSARYHVFLPSKNVLSWIGSYRDGGDSSGLDTIALGNVRFSSTRRRAVAAQISNAEVSVRVDDFVSRKTAVFGMTRTGKSNTIKTLVTAVYQHGHMQGRPIGQLILDPQGEYANENAQDGTGLRLLGEGGEHVRVYKHNPSRGKPEEFSLRINFLDVEALQLVWDMVQQEISVGVSSNAQYMAGFRSISMERPDPTRKPDLIHFERNRMAFYSLLHRAGIMGKLESVFLTIGKDVEDELNKVVRPTDLKQGSGGVFIGSTSTAEWFLTWIQQATRANADNKNWDSWVRDLENGDLASILKAMEGRAGDAAIKKIKPFHDASARGEIGELVWQDMVAGRLAIVDLSQGVSSVTKSLSERIVTTLMNKARDRFAEGDPAYPLQVVVEEAHNLFERGKKEVDSDPWVRLSKEAAKYKIGMMYATQEVSGVDRRVLSNTSNWLVAHLNSRNETNELAHYYDFATWADSIRKCEDVGFVRMKTHSSKYIVPIQVAKFDHEMINRARSASGLPPVSTRYKHGNQDAF